MKSREKSFSRCPVGRFSGYTLIEVITAAAVTVMAFGVVMTSAMKGLEIGKWQSAYETACSYGEQALEYALFVPYTDFSATDGSSTVNWVTNGLLMTSATATNYINTTKDGLPMVVTNVTFLATQTTLPLDDLGSYVLQRTVSVQDRSVIEPALTNLNYKLITVSNTWVFRGRAMSPIVFRTIRDKP
ncbi:MAG: hypothetical protein PHV34_23585 [Verrucomicrobiae bacterium]|nr:hypothetical protein [Verrucomicrobiae bacterium]